MTPIFPPFHRTCLTLLIASLLCAVVIAAGAATTEVHLVKYASDRSTVLAEKTVSADWMSQNLPVLGDGSTHYYLQGPTFDQANLWDPAESKNVQEKDMGAVKGTNLKDLCTLVGGMAAGDTLEVRSSDGFSKQFVYGNIYNPQPRQGPIGLVWYNADEGMVPAYQTGMRLVFFADTSVNPWHLHAFGISDMQATIPQDEWHYFNNIYPTTTGLSVQSIQEIRIYSSTAAQTAAPQPTTTQPTAVQTIVTQTTPAITAQPTVSSLPTQQPVGTTVPAVTTVVVPATTAGVIPITTPITAATVLTTVPVTAGSTVLQTGITPVTTAVSQVQNTVVPVSSSLTVVPVGNTSVTMNITGIPAVANNTSTNTTAVQQVVPSIGTPVSSVLTPSTPVPLTTVTPVTTASSESGVSLTGGIAYALGTAQENVTQTPTPVQPGSISTPRTLTIGQGGQAAAGIQTLPTARPTTPVPKSRSITGSVNLSFNLTAGGSSGSSPAPLTTGISTLLLWPLPVQIQASNLFEVLWWFTRALVH